MLYKKNKGFSMVELIIVIAIMAILIAVAAPIFLKYVERSRESTDIANMEEAYTVVAVAYADGEIAEGIDYYFDGKDLYLENSAPKAFKGYGKGTAANGRSVYTETCCRKHGQYDPSKSYKNGYIVVRVDTTSDGDIRFHVHWNVDNVLMTYSMKSSFGGTLSGTSDSGWLSLARALLSGYGSKTTMTNQKDNALKETFDSVYGITDTFVVNEALNPNASPTALWLLSKDDLDPSVAAYYEQHKDNPDDLKNHIQIRCVTEVNTTSPQKDEVYTATQYLYYGLSSDNAAFCYGSCTVYAKYDGTRFWYYSDAECTTLLPKDENTDWTRPENKK